MKSDAVIIGGGHNGLVCACYLARAGLKVRVLERRNIVGGAAVTEEFYPGFRNSTAAYTVSLLHAKVIRELRLAEHGLRIIERPFSNFLPLPDGNYFKSHSGTAAARAEVARFSTVDAERLPAFNRLLENVSDVLRELVLQTPPNVGGGLGDFLRALQTLGKVRKLDLPGQRDLLDLFTKSAGDILDAWFESEPLKAAFGFDSQVGNFASPYTPGSAYLLLHHAFGEVNGKKGKWGHALGGMGAITQAMAVEAKKRGVEISVDAPVTRVNIANGRTNGVMLEDGSEVEARCVVSNLNPKLLYLALIDRADLDADFVQRIEHYKCGSGTLRMNVALSELPDFTCLPGADLQPHHQSGIVIAPSLGYMERAYFDARSTDFGGMSREPIVEMLIPSTVDDSLAPRKKGDEGAHVASLFCQHFNPQLPDGANWDDLREAAADLAIETVNRYAPNFKASVLGRMTLTPLDLERKFGLIGGDIFHGALTLDQLYSARPVLGHADYRSPIRGLYLCGSGTHPGGGVTGLPGHNAAREIIRDFRSRKLGR
ncbi:MAG: NAD(P)/FAD-dependent oxidoreductase [Burkholderiales bacterium]|nr:NAD(P)/FAD-dependent oxidoreductase [Burkholderiales bacterium]